MGFHTIPHAGGRKISPLDIRFSQLKMRHLFGDGRRVAAAVPLVEAARCSSEEEAEHGAQWKLQAPFPTIEILRWRAKLRDEETGRPKVDSVSGEELYDSRAHWFTLDNRRLYCLQEAALKFWPERCVAEAVEVRVGSLTQVRELRKFRTLNRGRSVMVGSASDSVPFVRWSWREKVGVEECSDSSGPDAEARYTKVGTEKVWNADVLDYIDGMKHDDHARIEISKKISYILRRGAKALDVDMDADGWVKLEDLVMVDFVGAISMAKLLDVVEQSNKQKQRYELKEAPLGYFIRASGKRGTDHAATRRETRTVQSLAARRPVDERPLEAVHREQPGKGSKAPGGGKTSTKGATKGAEKGAVADLSTRGCTGKGKAGKASSQKAERLPAGALPREALPPGIVQPPRRSDEPKRCMDKDVGKDAPGAALAEGARPRDRITVADLAAASSGTSACRALAGPALATVAAPAAAAARKAKAALNGGGVTPQAAMAAKAAQQMQVARNMQHMQQMQAVASFSYQVQMQQQLQAMGQMRAMRQMEAQAFGYAKAMQEMQELVDQYPDAGEADEEAEVNIEDKIAKVMAAARVRSSAAGVASVSSGGSSGRAAPKAAANAATAVPAPAASIETLIAEALEAARIRGGGAVAAKPKAPSDIQAKIAEALEAAKLRSKAV